MASNLIPLLYVLAIGFVGFRIANELVPPQERLENRLFTLFVIVNITGFLTFSDLLFVPIMMLILATLATRDPLLRISAFLFLLPVVPSLAHSVNIGSFSLMYLDWTRLSSIVLLLPLLFRRDNAKPMFSYPVDKYILTFFLLNALLSFRDVTVTAGIRSVFYLLIEVVVPYYAITRYLTNEDAIRKSMLALLAALVIAGLVNFVETAKHWHLYDQMIRNVTGDVNFLPGIRAGMLRAFGALDKPSASAFALATGLGILWVLAPYPKRGRWVILVGFILATGLLLTFSRGSWVAAALIGIAFFVTTNARLFFRAVLGAVLLIIPLSFIDMTQDIIAIMPFIGEESSEAARTVEYREVLFETSIKVAHENPLFGSTTFDQHPSMDAIRQVSGLLDLVNHYLLVLLRTGYFGLVSFLAIFFSTILMILGARSASSRLAGFEQIRAQTGALLFTQLALLVAIVTTSAVGRVGLILWCLVAFSVASSAIVPSRIKLSASS